MEQEKEKSSRQDALSHFESVRRSFLKTRRRQGVLWGVLFLAVFLGSLFMAEISLEKVVRGFPGMFDFIRKTIPELHANTFVHDVGEWYWGLGKWLSLLLDTILIGFLGTVLGCTAAIGLCFPASRNLVKNGVVYFVCRRILEIARVVPELVYALIFVFAFGLGPLPGVLAISIHSAGALGKLFSEVNENIDFASVEGVKAAGGNWFQVVRYAVVPQVLPNFASYALLRFEINVRSAAIIGFVGAGGIGQELYFVIRQFIYPDISAIVLLVIMTVSLIDISCEKLRHRLIGREQLL
jgi:phosphonate transport system permease protein